MAVVGLSRAVEREIELALKQERDRLRHRIWTFTDIGRALAVFEEGSPAGSRADIASELIEHEVDLMLERCERRRLTEVEDALARLTAGRYGRCASCGDPVEELRLRALPWTRLCSRCAGAAQRASAGRAEALDLRHRETGQPVP